MADRTIKYHLQLDANTDRAKQALDGLFVKLHQIQKEKLGNFVDVAEFQRANALANELSQHLQKAVNVDTGRLDLNRFSQSLKSSNRDISYFYKELTSLGPAGKQAFLDLADSISTAEVGTIRINKKLEGFLSNLKKTATWQITSNITHGLESALSNAYRYAQDLNESLNEIRIVSGQSTEQMAKFAKEANKAAKALSATTIDYTDAALIYYQQGLSDEEIAERTEVTIKMANAAGQSAQVVSDQLTAIWNNFDDGSKSLEYYADVVAKLGAETASSTEEISTGLEKFAAAANTVGLSYEYATSALATVTSETRQSADVVGTAFRTLFTRIQGLSLGETLDDGTTLNKYSQALATVGVEIKNADGSLKEMDQILEDLGARWGSLSEDTKVGLAQTVGGARQYTTLISLMDNWDTFQKNLTSAKAAEGTIQKQADIYAESWEAAKDRVTAAAEEIYSKLINDEFFIDILNGFEKFLNGVSNVIDGLGGMKGMLLLVSSVFMRHYAKEMPRVLRNISANFGLITGAARKNAISLQEQTKRDLEQLKQSQDIVTKTRAENSSRIIDLNMGLTEKWASLSEDERAFYEQKIQTIQMLNDEIQQTAREVKELETDSNKKGNFLLSKGLSKNQVQKIEKKARRAAQAYSDSIAVTTIDPDKEIPGLIKDGIGFKLNGQNYQFNNSQFLNGKTINNVEELLADRQALSEFLNNNAVVAQAHIYNSNFYKNALPEMQAEIKEYFSLIEQGKSRKLDLEGHERQANESAEELNKFNKTATQSSEVLTHFASTVTSVVFTAQSLTSAFQVLNDENATFSDKLTVSASALSAISGNISNFISPNNIKQIGAMAAGMANFSNLSTEAQSAVKSMASTGTVSIAGLKGAFAALAPTIGSALLVLGAVATIIAGLVIIIKLVNQEIHAEEIALEEATKRLEEATEQYQKATEAAEKFKASISDYETAFENLDKLIQGTKEFNEALENSNNQAKELIQTYDLIKGEDWKYTETGAIEIFDSTKNKISQNLRDNQYLTEYNKLRAEKKYYTSLNAVDKKELYKDLRQNSRDYDFSLNLAVPVKISTANNKTLDTITSEYLNNKEEYDTNTYKFSGIKETDRGAFLFEDKEVLDKLLTDETRQILSDYSDTLEENNKKIEELQNAIKANTLAQMYGSELIQKYATDEYGNVDEGKANLIEGSLSQYAKTVNKANEVMNFFDSEDAYNDRRQFLSGTQSSHQDGYTEIKNIYGREYNDLFTEFESQFLEDISAPGEEAGTRTKANYKAISEAYLKTLGYTDIRVDESGKLIGAFNSEGVSVNGDTEGIPVLDQITLDKWLKGEFERRFLETIYAGKEEDLDAAYENINNANYNGIDLSNFLLTGLANGGDFNFASLTGSLDEASYQQLQGLINDETSKEDFLNALGLNENFFEDWGLEWDAFKREAATELDDWKEHEYRKTQNETYEKIAESKDIDVDEFKAYREILSKTNPELQKNAKLLNEVALNQVRVNQGLESLISNWDDFAEALSSGDTTKIAEIMPKLKEDISDVLDLSEDETKLLSADMLQDLYPIMQEVINGTEGAVEDLAIQTQYLLSKSWAIANGQAEDAVVDVYNTVNTYAASTEPVPIGTEINDEGFKAGLLQLIQEAKWTEEQVKQIFDIQGLEIDVQFNAEGEAVKILNLVTAEGYAGDKYKTSTVSPSLLKDRKKAQEDQKKKLDEELERYHEIAEVIEDITRQNDRLSKAKDRAWGGEKLALMDQEIQKTEELIAAQQEYLRQIEANAGADKAAIAAYGAQFDEFGRITNYDEIIAAQVNAYNAAIASGIESNIDSAEKAYEKFMKALQQYEETSDLLEEEYETLIDKQNELYDLALEKIEYKVEIKVEISERDKKYIDYLFEKSEGDAYAVAERIALISQRTGQLIEDAETYQQGIKDIFSNHDKDEEFIAKWLSGEIKPEDLAKLGFTEQEIQKLIEYSENLIDVNSELFEIRNTINEEILNAFNSFGEAVQKSTDILDFHNQVLTTYKDLVNLVGKQRVGVDNEFLLGLGQTKVNNSVGKLGATKTQLDAMKKSYEETTKMAQAAQQEYENALNNPEYSDAQRDELKKTVDAFQETLDEMEVGLREAEQEMLTSWQEALQTAAELYSDAIAAAIEEFEDQMAAGFGSIDALLDAYGRSRTVADQYLTEYKQIYELSKLTRNINNSIDDTDNIAGKEKLRDILAEIEQMQANGVEMSQYDLEYLQKRYELRLAEIALEDAQNAKSQVRMTRDADGNWNYTYTADDSAVDSARQNYEDKLFALQDLSQTYLDTISEQWIQAEKEWSQALQAIYEDATLTEEERALRIDSTNEFYKTRFEYFTSEIEKATSNNVRLYNEDMLAYSAKTDYQIASNEDFAMSFQDMILGSLHPNVQSIQELQSNVVDAIGSVDNPESLLGKMDAAYKQWQGNLEVTMNAAGTSMDGFKDTIEDAVESSENDLPKVTQNVVEEADKIQTAFGNMQNAVSKWMEEYAKKIAAATEQNEAYYKSITALIKAMSELADVESTYNNSLNNGSFIPNKVSDDEKKGTQIPVQTGSSSIYANFTVLPTPSDASVIINGNYTNTVVVPSGTSVTYKVSKYGYITKTKTLTVTGANPLESVILSKYPEPVDRSGFRQTVAMYDTGGYTGEWGRAGKLAMLHQKELVLNSSDTANILQTVDFVREISKMININAVSAGAGLGEMFAQTLRMGDQVLEQQVTIHAEFPNAVDHTEIEEAFQTLVNTATQYANRKS